MVRIGKKETFAIDYRVTGNTNILLGNICIWINDSYLGFFDEEVNIKTCHAALNRFLERQSDIEFEATTTEDPLALFNYFCSIEDNGKYMLGLGENFDDFSIFGFRNKELLNFLWKLDDSPFFSYQDYATEVKIGSVEIEYFTGVINEFNSELSLLNK